MYFGVPGYYLVVLSHTRVFNTGVHPELCPTEPTLGSFIRMVALRRPDEGDKAAGNTSPQR